MTSQQVISYDVTIKLYDVKINYLLHTSRLIIIYDVTVGGDSYAGAGRMGEGEFLLLPAGCGSLLRPLPLLLWHGRHGDGGNHHVRRLHRLLRSRQAEQMRARFGKLSCFIKITIFYTRLSCLWVFINTKHILFFFSLKK